MHRRSRVSTPHHLLDRLDDIRIRAATTQIAAHQLADVVGRARTPLAQETRGRHDLPRRAVAALERVVLDERFLQRVELAFFREPLDRRDLRAVMHQREREAREHALPTDHDGACAALTVIAALLRSREVEPVAQKVEERGPRLDFDLPGFPVDRERKGLGRGRCCGFRVHVRGSDAIAPHVHAACRGRAAKRQGLDADSRKKRVLPDGLSGADQAGVGTPMDSRRACARAARVLSPSR